MRAIYSARRALSNDMAVKKYLKFLLADYQTCCIAVI